MLVAAIAVLIVLGIVAALYVGLPLRSGSAGKPTIAQGPPAVVYGHIFARIADLSAQGGTRDIFLPGIAVELRGSKQRAEASVTNARGMFTSPPLQPDTYQVCWQAAGFEPGCTEPERRIVVDKTTTIAGPVEIKPKPGFVAGRVTRCSLQEPMFRLDLGTTVSLVNASGAAVSKPVTANHAGDFLIPDAPAGDLRLRAECNGQRAEAALSREKGALVTIALPRAPLPALSVTATVDDKPVRKVRPGQTVKVAVDIAGADKQGLHYRWFTGDTGRAFVSRDANTIDWTLPASTGLNTLQVLVTDARGASRIGRVSVQTGDSGAIFSATVLGADGKPVTGAEVSVNGTAATTNDQGYFFLKLPAESARYVLSIAARGQGLLSRVVGGEVVAVTYDLPGAKPITADPTQPINIGGNGQPQIQIDANALETASHQAPAGPLTFSVTSFDLTKAGQLPGNFGAVDSGNKPARQKSVLGAMAVEVRDAQGTLYNLKAGKTATLTIPLAPGQALGQSPPPATVALQTYDEKAGLWTQIGDASFANGAYSGTVSHFSAFSVGLLANDAACMRLHVDAGTVNLPVNLNILIPANDAVGANLPPFVANLTLGGIDLLSELPPNEPITLQLGTVELSKQVVSTGAANPGPADPNPAPASCTSDAQLAIAPNDAQGFDPNNPLFSAGGFLNYYGLDDEVSADLYYATIDPTSAAGTGTVSSAADTVTGAGTNFTTFFTAGDIIRAAGQTRTIKHITSDTQLETFTVNAAGLTAIPPLSTYERVGSKTTLDKFKTANEMSTFDAQATYFNAGDLGFGRSMHMKVAAGGTIAYFVSNYPNVEQARLNTGLIATVAMEYSPHPSGGAPYTKFYVFNAAGARVNNADLDQRGGKFVPRLCVICHAGTYAPPSNANLGNYGSRFIAFDLASYEYSGFDPTFSRTSQEDQFRLLNKGIIDHTNPSAAALDLITGWYNHDGNTITTPNQPQKDDYSPTNWTVAAPAGATTTPVQLYQDVVRFSCRTCHVNRDHPLDWARFTGQPLFVDPANSGFRQNGVTVLPALCGVRSMPHAKVTYINFWMHSSAASSPNRVNDVRNSKLDSITPAQACPTP